ncbi:MAG TPA: LptF/LptG family permease, partial [Candidatus Saccharimonadales bacterium]|nr:LptF/LptG family permease [Candidatus Saccharimonadales bacterium]
LFVLGIGLARQGNLPPSLSMWIPNIVLAGMGAVLLPSMEQFRGEGRWLRPLGYFKSWFRLLRRRKAQARARAVALSNSNGTSAGVEVAPSSGSFPRLMDLYLLRRFLSYFALLMVIFVFLFETFTFFELLDDIARHRVPFLVVVNYFRYLTPYLLYNLAPLGALIAVLVTLGTMSKNNEIVAIKASGISLYRLAVPLLLMGTTLAATMIVLDDTYLPYANQRQDALRNQIKGKPPQTYSQPQRWIFGESSKVYNYDVFDPAQNVFGGLSIVEIDPVSFQIRRRIFANRAQWSDQQKQWFLESGWVRDFSDGAIARYEKFKVTAFSELTEPPSYFNREVRQASQMNLNELRRYIAGLRKAGFDVSNLIVQWHVKLAFPLIAPIIMLLAIPFAFLVGTRGAISGVAMGVGIGLAYWIISRLLEAMGGVGQLPPFLAAWSPDVIFFFLGMYFFFKMPT